MPEMPSNKFKKYFEKKVNDTIRKYKLFTHKDRIAVAVSGGKDSTVLLYVLHKLGFNVEGITIDAKIGSYTQKNLENLQEVCKKYEIPLHIVSFREEFGKSLCYIRDVLKEKGYNYSSCMICGILKRYLLNKYARKFKFDFLATGHNLDDEAETMTMNLFRNDFKLARRQGPMTGVTRSKKFVQRVKPLYFLQNAETKRYSQLMKFPVNYGICPCSVKAYRREYREIFTEFEKKHPDFKYNIVKFQEQMKSNLKKEKKVKINTCQKCKQACAQEICKACTIFSVLRNSQISGTPKDNRPLSELEIAKNIKKVKKSKNNEK
ncbi:MAG: adenine nucleotide alpha hydrolase family protein [Nanoarchaeota archaeon]|nr:adenine nucleotide alpha hydrolase family protein [Nanoarchaeota archaeon]MBU1622572.1 adenine nucleotide alpha hydrolase family protein [Nanoarchaeota archaeon]